MRTLMIKNICAEFHGNPLKEKYRYIMARELGVNAWNNGQPDMFFMNLPLLDCMLNVPEISNITCKIYANIS